MEMKILSAGPLTTIQDKGRYGYMRYGITTSGVLDDKAYTYGNALLGNLDGEACLEMTVRTKRPKSSMAAISRIWISPLV